ncbi:RES family NAD+ phosphorylase [Variovorax sp. LjRoot84]|uniref:RES family NAD+ phosphorylase n=1 Tax=Variovorax sp. LjRoot84 TaxID=3342340 RepID=UPI003ECF9C17
MAHEFPSWQSYYDFANRVRRKERYVRSLETAAFLDTLVSTSTSRQRRMAAGTILWRAQLGFDVRTVEQDGTQGEMPAPHPPQRMKPLPIAPKDGRVNPAGISTLYLATDENTAVSEVRPWIGKHVSVAQFELLRDVRVVDCSLEHSQDILIYDEEPEPGEREKAVWRDVDRSFSEPVAADDPTTEYVPTQLIAEHFRAHQVEGVVYQSLLGGGKNVALFDLAAADLLNCALHYVRGVSFSYDQVANPYFVRKHYPE